MYESPIEIIREKMNLEFEENVVRAVQKCGIFVNRDELLKALQFDRLQYEVGYKDGYDAGYRKAVAEFKHSLDERFHRLTKDILGECEDQNDDKG